MKRRSFLKLLALAAASNSFVGKCLAAPVGFKLNPAWVAAPYEVRFLINHERPVKAVYPAVAKRGAAINLDQYQGEWDWLADKDPYPVRLDETGKVINPVIEL